MRLFLLGFAAGIAATLYAVGRGMGTASQSIESPPDETPDADPYLRDLAAILERERW